MIIHRFINISLFIFSLQFISVLSSPHGSKTKTSFADHLPKGGNFEKIPYGSSVKMIQEEYNVGKSKIYDLRSDKEKILQYAAECESANLMKNRKTMKPAKIDELDRVLYEWFKQRRSEGIPISGFILREKAREFHQTMDLEELLLYYIIIIIIFGEKFDYPVNLIIRFLELVPWSPDYRASTVDVNNNCLLLHLLCLFIVFHYMRTHTNTLLLRLTNHCVLPNSIRVVCLFTTVIVVHHYHST